MKLAAPQDEYALAAEPAPPAATHEALGVRAAESQPGWDRNRSRGTRSAEEDDEGPQHSKLGIASFAISVVALLVFIWTIVVGTRMQMNTPGGIDRYSPEAVRLGAIVLSLLLGDLIAIGLGAAALSQDNVKPIFAQLGKIIACSTLALWLVLAVLGALAG